MLKIEPVSGPLANPDMLQYLVPEVFEQILAKAEQLSGRVVSLESARAQLPACGCGRNPYRAFFTAAEQAMTEAGVLAQAMMDERERDPADLARLVFAIRTLACDEIDTFCSACVHRGCAAGCRFAVAQG